MELKGLEHGMSSLEWGYGTFSPFTEPDFQAFFRVQYQRKPWGMTHLTELDSRIQARKLEGFFTHGILEMHSSVESEIKEP